MLSLAFPLVAVTFDLKDAMLSILGRAVFGRLEWTGRGLRQLPFKRRHLAMLDNLVLHSMSDNGAQVVLSRVDMNHRTELRALLRNGRLSDNLLAFVALDIGSSSRGTYLFNEPLNTLPGCTLV